MKETLNLKWVKYQKSVLHAEMMSDAQQVSVPIADIILINFFRFQ